MATEAPSSRRQEDRMKKLGLVAVALSIVFAAPARAADFYVDPQNGSMANDGSAAKPWRTLQEVIDAKLIESQGWESLPPDGSTKLVAKNAGAPVKKGDTIWLRSGLHGSLSIVGYYNPDWITIAAEAGHTPKFSSVLLRAGAKWRLRGFVVSAELAEPYETRTLIDIEAHNWHGPISDIEIEGCELSSKADVSSWTMQNWDELACTGIQADGERITIRNNRLKNVDFGISVGARDSLVQGNVDTFLGFKFIHCERLGVDGSGDRRCIAWAKSGMHLGMWNDITTKISERADKSYATQVYVKGTFGATRTEEKKVVEIICDL